MVDSNISNNLSENKNINKVKVFNNKPKTKN